MTLEEARQLKPGDRVFIEANVASDETGRTIFADEALSISLDGGRGMSKTLILVNPYIVRKEAIRKKIETRRKFKKGDIVFFLDRLFFVSSDGDENETEIFLDGDYYWARNSEIKLICAVEDRSDRKGEA